MKSDKVVLNLRQFLIRREVLKTYKDFIKCINQVEDANYRNELTRWVRGDFKVNKNIPDEAGIKIELTRAKMSLKEFESSIGMAK